MRDSLELVAGRVALGLARGGLVSGLLRLGRLLHPRLGLLTAPRVLRSVAPHRADLEGMSKWSKEDKKGAYSLHGVLLGDTGVLFLVELQVVLHPEVVCARGAFGCCGGQRAGRSQRINDAYP